MKKLHIADLITAIRIPGSLLLLVLPVFSVPSMIVYLICGLSDMIDGTAARMTGSSGAFGERLDTIADFVFASAALIRLLPCLPVPGWVWAWTAAIAYIKLAAAAAGLIRCGKLVAVHSVLNKLMGLLLFLFPLSLRFLEIIAVFKIKAHIHMNETTLNSQKAKHSERRVESHWEEHPVTLP